MSNTVSGLSVGRGLLYLIVAGAAWGTAGAAASLVYRTSDMGPVALSFWRCAAGLVLLLAARLLTRRPGPPPPSRCADGRCGPGPPASGSPSSRPPTSRPSPPPDSPWPPSSPSAPGPY
ncbi:hypothetical protein SHKM778_61120 [Streptomyces sp. KM77-8]|uniref:EamA domain-containing protein n=1 Tax=Streptomyces haneummycinicus TaxID=3074435 RepID=A0AAT9HQI7_9ACTN